MKKRLALVFAFLFAFGLLHVSLAEPNGCRGYENDTCGNGAVEQLDCSGKWSCA